MKVFHLEWTNKAATYWNTNFKTIDVHWLSANGRCTRSCAL